MLNADTLTDDQLRSLACYIEIGSREHDDLNVALRKIAPRRGDTFMAARARCAEILNARAAAKCHGRTHRNHTADTCNGSCCTACGGPIDENEECRC